MNSHELNHEGRKRVEDELLRRGAASVVSTTYGTHRTYLIATHPNNSRTVELRIKTKQKGRWHTTIEEAQPTHTLPNFTEERSYWVFMDLNEPTRYWIVPDGWIRNDIYQAHQKYLQKHSGHRAKNDNSNHHAIEESRLQPWKDRWEILNIF
jgi:hypothetical protein